MRGSPKSSRHRVTQEDIDTMSGLRKQGFPLRDVGARVGLSERSARRYVGQVRPELQIPTGISHAEVDPHTLRQRLLKELLEDVYQDRHLRSVTVRWVSTGPDSARAVYGNPPSILFLNEAERLLREALAALGSLALEYLAREQQSKCRFLREVVGELHRDYLIWHDFDQRFGCGEGSENWRPPRERPPQPDPGDDMDLDP